MRDKLPAGHLLAENDDYREGFWEAFEKVYGSLENKDKEKIILEKFFIGNGNVRFDLNQFVQFSCELSVGNYFSDGFRVISEARLTEGSKKDIDWQVQDKPFAFNLEVKCSEENEFDKVDEATDKGALQMKFVGRVPEKDEAIGTLGKIASGIGMGLSVPKHADCRLKDYLIDAHKKFGDSGNLTTLNVLVVCCGHFYNIREWWSYLFSTKGLFCADSFSKKEEYRNVDGVLLTSLRYGHQHEQGRRRGSWSLSNAFNLFFRNPYGRKNVSSECVERFLKISPNHNEKYRSFRPSAELGTPEVILDTVKLWHYCCEYLTEEQRQLYWPGSPYRKI